MTQIQQWQIEPSSEKGSLPYSVTSNLYQFIEQNTQHVIAETEVLQIANEWKKYKQQIQQSTTISDKCWVSSPSATFNNLIACKIATISILYSRLESIYKSMYPSSWLMEIYNEKYNQAVDYLTYGESEGYRMLDLETSEHLSKEEVARNILNSRKRSIRILTDIETIRQQFSLKIIYSQSIPTIQQALRDLTDQCDELEKKVLHNGY